MSKSTIWDIELPKNISDIRNYFNSSDASKIAIKQGNREQNTEDTVDQQESHVKVTINKIDKKRWGNEIQKNWIKSYFS